MDRLSLRTDHDSVPGEEVAAEKLVFLLAAELGHLAEESQERTGGMAASRAPWILIL